MNKSHLINHVADELRTSKLQAALLVETVLVVRVLVARAAVVGRRIAAVGVHDPVVVLGVLE